MVKTVLEESVKLLRGLLQFFNNLALNDSTIKKVRLENDLCFGSEIIRAFKCIVICVTKAKII